MNNNSSNNYHKLRDREIYGNNRRHRFGPATQQMLQEPQVQIPGPSSSTPSTSQAPPAPMRRSTIAEPNSSKRPRLGLDLGPADTVTSMAFMRRFNQLASGNVEQDDINYNQLNETH